MQLMCHIAVLKPNLIVCYVRAEWLDESEGVAFVYNACSPTEDRRCERYIVMVRGEQLSLSAG